MALPSVCLLAHHLTGGNGTAGTRHLVASMCAHARHTDDTYAFPQTTDFIASKPMLVASWACHLLVTEKRTPHLGPPECPTSPPFKNLPDVFPKLFFFRIPSQPNPGRNSSLRKRERVLGQEQKPININILGGTLFGTNRPWDKWGPSLGQTGTRSCDKPAVFC